MRKKRRRRVESEDEDWQERAVTAPVDTSELHQERATSVRKKRLRRIGSANEDWKESTVAAPRNTSELQQGRAASVRKKRRRRFESEDEDSQQQARPVGVAAPTGTPKLTQAYVRLRRVASENEEWQASTTTSPIDTHELQARTASASIMVYTPTEPQKSKTDNATVLIESPELQKARADSVAQCWAKAGLATDILKIRRWKTTFLHRHATSRIPARLEDGRIPDDIVELF